MDDTPTLIHPLDAWIKASPHSQGEFAARIGISAGHLSSIISRKRGVSLEVALDIERETGGAVRARDFDTRLPAEAAE